MRRIYPRHPFVGVGALIIQNGKILLEKRGSQPGKGKWSIPGGLVELGERAHEAVIREVKEEAGIEVDKPQLVDVVDNIDLDRMGRVRYHFVIIDYFVRLRGGKLEAASDAAELRWTEFKEVESLDLTQAFRAFFVRNRRKLDEFSSGY
jgi:mutator protein MutT